MEKSSLVQRAKDGDVNAFAELYKEIYKDLYRFALYMLKNPTDAEDIVSDTVVNAFAAIHKLRSADAFKAWIFKILSNKCRSKLKEYSDKYTVFDVCADPVLTVDSCADDVITRQAFYELTEQERIIIGLHIFGGYTSKEISRALKLNENTVRSKERRALEKLAEKLR